MMLPRRGYVTALLARLAVENSLGESIITSITSITSITIHNAKINIYFFVQSRLCYCSETRSQQ